MASTGSVGTLSWSAKLDSNEFKKGVRKVKKEMKEAQKAVGQSLKMMAQSFTIATGAVAGLTGALALLTKETADTVNAQNILAESIGSTQSEIAGLELASNALGVSYDQLIDKMREIGGVDAFKRLADQVSSAETATAQMAIAQEALGNEGLKLLPILQQGSVGLAKFEQEARKLGLALPEKEVKALVDAWSDYEALQFRLIGLSRKLGAELAPIFEGVLQDTVSFVDDNSAEIEVLFDNLGNYFESAMDGIKFALESVGIIDEISTWSDIFMKSAWALENSWKLALKGIAIALEKTASVISFPFRAVGELILDIFQGVFIWIQRGLKALGKEFQTLDEIINELELRAVAIDANNIAGAFDGILGSEAFDSELENSWKRIEERVKSTRKEIDKLGKAQVEAVGGDLMGDYFDMLEETMNYNKGKKAKEDGSDDPVKVEVEPSQGSNVLATAGSIEEFNLMSAQRKEELNIAKKQLEELKKLNKDKSTSAGFTK